MLKYTNIKEFDNSKSIGDGLKTLTISAIREENKADDAEMEMPDEIDIVS